jgi:hypothetical protein
MTRIKYSRKGSVLVTDFITIGPNSVVRGVILSDFVYYIYTFDADVMYSGQSSNLRNAKAKIKQLLLSCGAKFKEEIRNR